MRAGTPAYFIILFKYTGQDTISCTQGKGHLG